MNVCEREKGWINNQLTLNISKNNCNEKTKVYYKKCVFYSRNVSVDQYACMLNECKLLYFISFYSFNIKLTDTKIESSGNPVMAIMASPIYVK